MSHRWTKLDDFLPFGTKSESKSTGRGGVSEVSSPSNHLLQKSLFSTNVQKIHHHTNSAFTTVLLSVLYHKIQTALVTKRKKKKSVSMSVDMVMEAMPVHFICF